jgi:hypothetical protein
MSAARDGMSAVSAALRRPLRPVFNPSMTRKMEEGIAPIRVGGASDPLIRKGG